MRVLLLKEESMVGKDSQDASQDLLFIKVRDGYL